jgi:T-complex protein 1 subunit beta
MRQKCDKIIAHGCNVFINRQLIYNLPESIFTENGVMAIEHADFDGIERLAAVTGGEVASTFDRPDLVTLGECDVIEEVRVAAYCRIMTVLRGAPHSSLFRSPVLHRS